MLALSHKLPKAVRVPLLLLAVTALFMIGEPNLPLFKGLGSVYGAATGKELQTHDYFYRIVYCSLCVLIILIYTYSWEKTKIALYVYGTTLVVSLLLVKTGKSIPELAFAYRAGAQLIGIMVSPFPVVLFIPALYLLNMNDTASKS